MYVSGNAEAALNITRLQCRRFVVVVFSSFISSLNDVIFMVKQEQSKNKSLSYLLIFVSFSNPKHTYFV